MANNPFNVLGCVAKPFVTYFKHQIWMILSNVAEAISDAATHVAALIISKRFQYW